MSHSLSLRVNFDARLREKPAHPLGTTRDDLRRKPHDDSIIEEFVKEPSALPEGIAESRDRHRSIVTRMEQAIAERDFATARSCSEKSG